MSSRCKIEVKDTKWNITEYFGYDHLNRLTTLNGDTYVAYDDKGNITYRAGIGYFEYNHPSKPYAVTDLMQENNVVPSGNQEITYTSTRRFATISENGYFAQFQYDSSDDRTKMQVKYNDEDYLTRYYIGSRYERDITSGHIREKLYLEGDAYSAPAVYVKEDDGEWTLHYLLRDYLGSIAQVTESKGVLVQELSYDPWGRLRNPDTHEYYAFGTEPELFLGRGYTGHEHLATFGLINMNARLYDPITGRFLSPDPYVQAPDFSQSYNRYAYGLNNPLIYTDPDGEFWFIIAGALLGAYIGGSAAEGNLNPAKWNWDKNTWVGMGIGAGVGALGGWGYSYAAPALANTAFFSHFGMSGTVAAYGLTGTVIGGAIGYGAGLGSALYSSDGDWKYAHKMGGIMSGVGSQIGSIAGTLAGNWKVYQEQMNNLKSLEIKIDKSIDNARQIHSEMASWTFYGGAGMGATSEMFFSRDLGTWMGKNGQFYDQSWGGNQYTGGKYKYANSIAKPFRWGSNALGAYSMYNSVQKARLGEMSIEEATGDVAFGGAAMYSGFWGGWANFWYGLGKEYGPMTTYLRLQEERREKQRNHSPVLEYMRERGYFK